MTKDYFGNRFIYWENHVGDDEYQTAQTQARGSWYGVSGIPDVRIDGKTAVIGAGDCQSAYNNYRTAVNQHLAENGGMSPIEITGSYLISGNDLLATTNFRLLDPASLIDLRATLLLYEDEVDGVWPNVTRLIYDRTITLQNVGDNVDVATTFTLDPTWNLDKIYVVAYLQRTTGNKEIYQAYQVPLLPDFTLVFDNVVRSVPNGSGTAVFDAVLTNIGDATDTITLQLGNPFGDWPSDFLVCGDSNPHTEPVVLVLDPAESCDLKVRVHTDDVKEVRPGGFQAHSQFSDRTQTTTLQVYNGSYSIFFVDDDRAHSDETPLENALNVGGYLYENWDCYYGHDGLSPRFADVSGYDVLIWHNSWWPQSPSALVEDDVLMLMEYMDGGGSLFLTSQLFLNTPAGPTSFRTDYLGIASYTVDPGYTHMYGVADDPIGDGLDLPLTFPFGSLAKGDHVVPGPNATVCMTAPNNVNTTIRNEMQRGAKSVFMAVALNAVDPDDPDPNNLRTVLSRIIEWLAPAPAVDDVDDAPNTILASRIDGIRPNPFNPRTEIVFTLSQVSAAGPVQLEIYDLEGRRVADVFEGRLDPGTHTRTWNGLADDGTSVRSGVYFGHLTTKEGTFSQKLILLK